MNKERNALKAGLFILTAVVLSVGIVIAINGSGRLFESQQTRVVSFKLTDDIGGLRVGDDVRVGGHRVGSVKGIEAVGIDSGSPKLLVTYALPSKYKLSQDAIVGVQSSLTGATILNISALGTGQALKDGEELAGRPDPKSALFAAASDLAKDVKETTLPKVNATVDTYKKTGEEATALITHVRSKIDPSVEKYNTVADKGGAMMDSVREMIGPSTKDWHGTLADIHEMTTGIKGKLPGMLDKVEKSIDGAQKALEDVQATVANTRDISGNIKSVLAGNKGKLEGLLASVKTTGDNLKAASSEIRRSPWRLLYQPKQDELNNLNMYDSARQFAEGANQLNDAAQALRDAVNSKEASPEQIQAMVNKLEKSFVQFHEVEDKLWKGVKE